MKKKLESELVSIAHRILKLKGKEDVIKMHAEVSLLYEKLTVLKFANENFESDLPIIGSDSSFFGMLDSAFNNKVSDTIEVENKLYTNLDANENEDIVVPVMDKIKDMMAFMPEETKVIETHITQPEVVKNKPIETKPFEPKIVENKVTETKAIETKVVETRIEEVPVKAIADKPDLEDITAGFGDIPVFEPIGQSQNDVFNGKKSLNDRIKTGGLHIGLNDKIAFIKHLFDGKSEDYDRVLSQLNTFRSFANAKNFMDTIVKPDYNNWDGKEEFEERFIQIIEAKFN